MVSGVFIMEGGHATAFEDLARFVAACEEIVSFKDDATLTRSLSVAALID